MSRGAPEPSYRSSAHGRDRLPYDPQEWHRRLAEARARRAVALRQRSAAPLVQQSPAERLAAAWGDDPEGLAEVMSTACAPHTARSVPVPKVLPRETAAPPRTARRLLALTPLACCIVGASFLGLAAIAAGVAWRHPPQASAEAAAPVPVTKTEAASAPGIDVALAAEALPEEPQSADTPDADAASAAFAVDGAVEEPPLDRVVILAPTSVPAAGRSEAAAILREAGWPAEEPRTSPFTISRTHVRYYHAADRDAAAELAALLSAEARDFTGYRPSPPAGMVELWLAGKAAPRPPAGTPPPLRQLLDHLALVLEGR